jgi:lysophospholipase L1-like esterase
MKDALDFQANCLARLADPRWRFHAGHLGGKHSRINRRTLVTRLPHVAIIGDSLSKDVYISSRLRTFWCARRRRGRSWVFDHARTSGYSVCEKLERLTPFVALECGGVGALVDNEGDRQSFFRRILGTRNFSGQVTQLVSRRRFPDLILIWIGHNNVDWTWWSSPAELERSEKTLPRQSARFRQNYARQVRRLLHRARAQRHRVAIVIYGLVDFASFFKAREIIEALREKNPQLYPYLETGYKYFASLRPPYRPNVARLAQMINGELQAMTEDFERGLDGVPNVQVRYSDALATVDLSRVEVIHAMDGWHPSAEGHKRFAEAAFNGLAPSLEFLGITMSNGDE